MCKCELLRRERPDFSDLVSFDDCFCRKLEGLETLERLRERGAADHHAVVLEDHAVVSLLKRRRDFLAELSTARQRIGSEPRPTTNRVRLMEHPCVRHLAANAERHQRHRMRMHNRANVGPHRIDRLVKRKFRRRRMRPVHRAIGLDSHDVIPREAALVHPSRRDPNIAARFANRKVPARSGRHPVAVNPLHGGHNFVAWVGKLSVHG